MKKFFFISLLLLLGLLSPLTGLLAVSSGNATDKLYYNLNENINAYVPTELYLFAYYNLNGEFILSNPEGDLASYIKNNDTLGNGQAIKVIYAYQDDISSSDYNTVIADYESREYTVIYYTNEINIGTLNYSTTDDISIVNYTATTTKIDENTSVIIGSYYIPFILFIFMSVLFFAIMLVVVLSIYFIKTKKNDY
jgi:ABC-type multidrug transport system fused ATPase/permease subunit